MAVFKIIYIACMISVPCQDWCHCKNPYLS